MSDQHVNSGKNFEYKKQIFSEHYNKPSYEQHFKTHCKLNTHSVFLKLCWLALNTWHVSIDFIRNLSHPMMNEPSSLITYHWLLRIVQGSVFQKVFLFVFFCLWTNLRSFLENFWKNFFVFKVHKLKIART